MKRGEVWWATLPAPSGSGPGLRRPVLIVQSNAFNDSRIATVVVAAITSNTRLAGAPGNVALSQTDSGLPKASVVNVSQLLSADRAFLSERVRELPPALLQRVDRGLRGVLGI
jgi:mRNA interferase MazF